MERRYAKDQADADVPIVYADARIIPLEGDEVIIIADQQQGGELVEATATTTGSASDSLHEEEEGINVDDCRIDYEDGGDNEPQQSANQEAAESHDLPSHDEEQIAAPRIMTSIMEPTATGGTDVDVNTNTDVDMGTSSPSIPDTPSNVHISVAAVAIDECESAPLPISAQNQQQEMPPLQSASPSGKRKICIITSLILVCLFVALGIFVVEGRGYPNDSSYNSPTAVPTHYFEYSGDDDGNDGTKNWSQPPTAAPWPYTQVYSQLDDYIPKYIAGYTFCFAASEQDCEDLCTSFGADDLNGYLYIFHDVKDSCVTNCICYLDSLGSDTADNCLVQDGTIPDVRGLLRSKVPVPTARC